MSNFSPRIEDSSENQLKDIIQQTDPRYGSLASDELTRRLLNNLEKTLNEFNIVSSKQTEKMIQLTWVIIVLTVIMVLGLIIQILLSVYSV